MESTGLMYKSLPSRLIVKWQNTPPHDRSNAVTCFIDREFRAIGPGLNPYEAALTVLDAANDTSSFGGGKRGTTSLPFVFLQQFEKWADRNPDIVRHCLTQDIKRRAFQCALNKYKSSTWISAICSAFRLHEDGQHLLQDIRDLLSAKQYDEAFKFIMCMKLENHFTIEELIIPLLLQDKFNVVEEHIAHHPNLQQEIITILDRIAESPNEVQQLRNQWDVPGVRMEKMKPGALNKLVGRLMKRFGIPPEKCPNLVKKRQLGALRYLLHRRYIEQSITGDSWEEMVKVAVGNNEEIQLELIIGLISYNDANAALKFASYFAIPMEKWPDELKKMSHKEIKDTDEPEELMADDEISYLWLRLDADSIHFVQTEAELIECIDDIAKHYDVVGVDAEWKPTFGAYTTERLSLIQLAVWDSVYLLDMLALQKVVTPSGWKTFIDLIFYNQNLLKLGFSISGDLKALAKFIPENEKLPHKAKAVLDLCSFSRFARAINSKLMEPKSTTAVPNESIKGLSELCLTLLGHPLRKIEQFSDWENRPLRPLQVTYAALDAYCLLQVYEELTLRTIQLGLNLDLMIRGFLKNGTGKDMKIGKAIDPVKETNETTKTLLETCPSDAPPMEVKDFRVVVDTMLQGLGRHLRIFGVDTVILSNTDDHEQAVKIAKKEKRIILTSGAPYQQLKNHVPEGTCISVDIGLPAHEQASHVFHIFNVQIKSSDIFSRCTVCNGGNYVEIPSSELLYTWTKKCKDAADANANSAEDIVGTSTRKYPGGLYDRESGVINGTCEVQLSSLSRAVFNRVKTFFVCSLCGKVYWEGSHYGRVRRQSAGMLRDT